MTIANVVTPSRLAIMAALKSDLTANGDPFEVVAGERDGVSRDRNIACVFAAPLQTAGDVNFTNPGLIVRAWVKQPKPPKATSPQDPGPVEQLMFDLARVLSSVQIPAGVDAYWITQSIEPDYPDWGVQATLTGWTINPAAVVQ